MNNAIKPFRKRRDPIARDLLSPKYKMRVVGNKKKDHRKLAEILGKIAC